MIFYILFLFFHTIKVTQDLSSEFPINTDNNYGNIGRNKFKTKIRNNIYKRTRKLSTSPYERNIVTLEQPLNLPIISDDIHNVEETITDKFIQIFTSTGQAIQDNTNVDQFLQNFTSAEQDIEDNTNVGQFIEDNTNIRQNMQIFTTTDQNMQIFTPTEQAVQDNTNIDQFIEDFINTEQFMQNFAPTDQIEKEKSSTQSNGNVFIENKEEQNNLTISNSKIQEIAKEVINKQNNIFKDKLNDDSETLNFEQNLVVIKDNAHSNELKLVIEGYEKLYNYVQNEPVLLEVQILEVLNEALKISSDNINYHNCVIYMNLFYNRYKTLINDNIPFLREKILESSITKQEKKDFFIYFDYFENIIAYILNYNSNVRLSMTTYVYNLYKYIRLIIQMPEFLAETNYIKIYKDFVEKVENLKFDGKHLLCNNSLKIFKEFKKYYSFVLKANKKIKKTALECCAHILQNYHKEN